MRDAELTSVLTRRALIIGGGEAVLFLILIARLYQLQIKESNQYRRLSDRNILRLKLLPPPRGLIIDRNGEELARNRNSYEILMIPEEVAARGRTVEDTIARIGELIALSPRELDRINADLKRKRAFVPIMIKNHMSWDDMAKVQLANLELPGVYVEEGMQRNYPFAQVGSHSVGYAGAVGEDDIKNDPYYDMAIPDMRIGKNGVERLMERELRGEPGEEIQVVNAAGRVIENLETRRRPPVSGRTIRMTIDRRLQEYANKLIEHETASAVIMDIFTGDVILMISTPEYNPNIFQNYENVADRFAEYISSPFKPLMNRSIEGLYPPGSTFKMVTTLAALGGGIVTPNTRFSCPGKWEFGGRDWHCWNTQGHGSCDAVRALAVSCDVYYYNIGAKINMTLIQEMAYKLGLANMTGIGLMNEKAGQVPGREWKRNFRSEPWYTGDTIASTIGQGNILTTPLQLAVMTARIANGGLDVKPRIVRGEFENPSFDPIGLDPKHLEIVQRGMYGAVNAADGTARRAAIDYHGQYTAGKTGTSQVRQFTKDELKFGTDQTRWPREHRSHAFYVGYAPYKSPRYAISVVLEHGIGGGAYAAPVARNLMQKALELEKI